MTHLVGYVEVADVVVDADRVGAGRQQVDDVRHCRRCPAAPLVEELVEALRGVRQRVRRGCVVYAVSLLEEQGAQPAVFTWKREGHGVRGRGGDGKGWRGNSPWGQRRKSHNYQISQMSLDLISNNFFSTSRSC